MLPPSRRHDVAEALRRRRRFIPLLALLFVSAGSLAKTSDTGFVNRSVVLDGVERRYQVYVPREYDRSKSWPVILAFHGGGQYGSDGVSQTDIGLAHAIRLHPERYPVLVVFPQSPVGTPGFQGLGEQIALATLDQVQKEFHGDPSRIYLTGLSMGGNGAYYLAYKHPERFAAVLVACGFVEAFIGKQSGVHYPPIVSKPDTDLYTDIALHIAKLPIWIFQGDADPTVSVEVSRHMHAALKAAGANVQYTELPGVGHNSWIQMYDRQDVIEWLLRQKRR